MPTTFRVESIVWERVNLTLDFRLAWIHPDGRTLESVGPASVDVHEPGGDGDDLLGKAALVDSGDEHHDGVDAVHGSSLSQTLLKRP